MKKDERDKVFDTILAKLRGEPKPYTLNEVQWAQELTRDIERVLVDVNAPLKG